MDKPILSVRKKVVVVGISGGSSAGKTTVANKIIESIGKEKVAYIQQDSYYKDQSNISPEKRGSINYDHSGVLENDLLVHHLQELCKGHNIKKPLYDFKTHTKKSEIELVHPKEIIIVEGALIFADKRLRNLMNIKVFIDTDADIRFIRRIKRDIAERGRTMESVINQYLNTVRPMHLKFVEPSKRYADIVIPEGGFNKIAINKLISMIRVKIEGDQIT